MLEPERNPVATPAPLALRFASKALHLFKPGMPGKTRAARYALRPFLHGENALLSDRAGRKYLVPSLREPMALHLVIDGMYEPETLEFLASRTGPGSTFVDVGANIGLFAIPMARRVGAAGRVVAIEASPRIFPYLAHNVAANQSPNVRLWNVAASDAQVPALAFYEAPATHFGMGSIGPQFDAAPVSVPATTLDYVLAEENIAHVDVLKVDVEGYESAVFRGAARLLNGARPPVIVFEFCDWAEARIPGSQTGDAQKSAEGIRLYLLASARLRPSDREAVRDRNGAWLCDAGCGKVARYAP